MAKRTASKNQVDETPGYLVKSKKQFEEDLIQRIKSLFKNDFKDSV